MSEPDSNEFLQRITKLIQWYCKEHAGSSEEESLEASKMIFTIMGDVVKGLVELYPKDLAEYQYLRLIATRVPEALEFKRPSPRMIFDALRGIVVALFVGTRKLTQEEFDESPFAQQLPSPVMGFNYRELADAAEILHNEAMEGSIKLFFTQ